MYGISMFITKKCIDALVQLLLRFIYINIYIFYKSFETGIIPSQLKFAKVIPMMTQPYQLSSLPGSLSFFT
jgi:hypothetical protein